MIQTDFNILFEDSYMMVIEKPPGLVVEPSETQKVNLSLAEILVTKFNIGLDRGGIVHRLDKDTSGLMLVAKTQSALETLQSQFKQRTIKKDYLTLVHGFVKQPGKVEAAVARNPGNREKFIALSPTQLLDSQKEAVTEYQPLKYFVMPEKSKQEIFGNMTKPQLRKFKSTKYDQFTLVLCHPLTGRTHQIRIHLKYINFPIVKDDKYVGRKIGRLDNRWCKRQFLHAARLEFNHPVTNERMIMESNLPSDLSSSLDYLEQTNI